MSRSYAQMAYQYTLRDIRVAKGIAASKLAAALHISPQRYRDIECGRRDPSAEILARLAAFFNTSMDCIYHTLQFRRRMWYFPDAYLEQGRLAAAAKDEAFLRGFTEEDKEYLRNQKDHGLS